MIRHLFWLLLFLCPSTYATITAQTHPTTIQLGDTFRLTLTIDGPTSGSAPQLIPLQHDFEIDSTEHRVSTTIINGQMQTLNQWAILLTPKKSGTLQIPPIQVGGEQSNAVTIEVTSNASHTSSTQSETKISSTPARVQLQTEISEKAPYVNQQITYTVKLVHQDQLLDAAYQPPNLEEALIVPLGDSEQYQVTEHDQTYTVEEQRYAIFPQKIGKQSLTSPSFQALIYNGMPERIRVKNKPIALNVKPSPKKLTAKQWLPAKNITLTEQYDETNATLKVGTTLVRTIRIEGHAIPAELLPTLAAKPQESYGVYPEKPISKNSIHNQDIVGIKTMQITYLLNQPGTITLPAYTLTWFNTTKGMEETSTLPARTVTVQGKKSLTEPTQSSKAQTHHQEKQFNHNKKSSRMPWIIVMFLSILWIVTILGFFIYKKRPHLRRKKTCVLNNVKHACIANNPIEARAALIAWAQQQWPNITFLNLDDVKAQLHNEALSQALSTLAEALYGKTTSSTWQGDVLWQCIKAYRPTREKQQKNTHLPPINPTGLK